MYSIEAAKVVKVVRYIPVDEATIGWSPSSIKSGTKAAPGPMPQNAVAMDPKKAVQAILVMFLGVAYRSPSTNSKSHASFSLYSCLTITTPTMKAKTEITCKRANKDQSAVLQRTILSGEVLPLPRMNEIAIRIAIMSQLRSNFFHCKLVFSLSMMASRFLSFSSSGIPPSS